MAGWDGVLTVAGLLLLVVAGLRKPRRGAPRDLWVRWWIVLCYGLGVAFLVSAPRMLAVWRLGTWAVASYVVSVACNAVGLLIFLWVSLRQGSHERPN